MIEILLEKIGGPEGLAATYLSGMTIAEIAVKFGVADHSVIRAMKRFGIQRRPAKMRKSRNVERILLRATWGNMIRRCLTDKDKSAKNYFFKGVTVCPSWLNSFEAFLADMGPKPAPNYQLDRIDSNKGYSPENCRWVTPSQNARNTSANHVLVFRGESKPLVEWAECVGLSPRILGDRIRKLGWSLEKALSTPAIRNRERGIDGKFVDAA